MRIGKPASTTPFPSSCFLLPAAVARQDRLRRRGGIRFALGRGGSLPSQRAALLTGSSAVGGSAAGRAPGRRRSGRSRRQGRMSRWRRAPGRTSRRLSPPRARRGGLLTAMLPLSAPLRVLQSSTQGPHDLVRGERRQCIGAVAASGTPRHRRAPPALARRRRGRGHRSGGPCPSLATPCYGTSLLMRVDQLPRAVRPPGPWLAPPQVPSRLSPDPPAKNGPPQAV